MVEKCTLCGASYDPRAVTHRQGTDCARVIAENLSQEIKSLHQDIEDARSSFASMLASLDSLRQVSTAMDDTLNKRIDSLAKRVNVLEHPRMAGKVGPREG